AGGKPAFRRPGESRDPAVRKSVASGRSSSVEDRRPKTEDPLHIVPTGTEAAFLSAFPLSLLTWDAPLLALLEGVGVRSCGELADLPAEAAEVRFGNEGVRLWK